MIKASRDIWVAVLKRTALRPRAASTSNLLALAWNSGYLLPPSTRPTRFRSTSCDPSADAWAAVLLLSSRTVGATNATLQSGCPKIRWCIRSGQKRIIKLPRRQSRVAACAAYACSILHTHSWSILSSDHDCVISPMSPCGLDLPNIEGLLPAPRGKIDGWHCSWDCISNTRSTVAFGLADHAAFAITSFCSHVAGPGLLSLLTVKARHSRRRAWDRSFAFLGDNFC